jgi:hypothetical protein
MITDRRETARNYQERGKQRREKYYKGYCMEGKNTRQLGREN